MVAFRQPLCCRTSQCYVNALNILVVTTLYRIFVVKFIKTRLDKKFPDSMILEYRSLYLQELALRFHPF
jgi:hypothetical protein